MANSCCFRCLLQAISIVRRSECRAKWVAANPALVAAEEWGIWDLSLVQMMQFITNIKNLRLPTNIRCLRNSDVRHCLVVLYVDVVRIKLCCSRLYYLV